LPVDPAQLSRFDRAGYFSANLVLRGLIGLALAVPYRWRVPAMGWLVSQAFAPLSGARHNRSTSSAGSSGQVSFKLSRIRRRAPERGAKACDTSQPIAGTRQR